MSSSYNDKLKPQKPNTTTITRSQRSDVAVGVFRWRNGSATDLMDFRASRAGILEGGRAPIGDNLQSNPSPLMIINDVTRVNVSKNKGQSSGTFSLMLKQGRVVRGGKIQQEKIDYLKAINVGDWVMIYIRKEGLIKREDIGRTDKASGFKCLGIVENIRYVETDKEDDGKPNLEYMITGQDFGKVFDQDVFFNPIIDSDTAATVLGASFFSDAIDTVKAAKGEALPSLYKNLNPQALIKKLIGFYLGDGRSEGLDTLNSTHQTWYIPDTLSQFIRPKGGRSKTRGVSFVDILDTSKIGLQKYNNFKLTKTDPLPGYPVLKALPSTGTVWSILQFLSNSITNEMYTELVPEDNSPNAKLRPALVMRQIPFSNKHRHPTSVFTQLLGQKKKTFTQVPGNQDKTFFTDLPRHEIVSSDIRMKNIGKSEFERINHILVVPRVDEDVINAAFNSLVNVASVQRHGLKSFRAQSAFVFDPRFNFLKICEYYLHLLADWFFMSHQLYNGTIIIDGQNEHIQIGNNLYIKDIQQLFHIEGYTHNFIRDHDGRVRYDIELRVSRGQFVSDKGVASFIGESSEIEATTITSVNFEGEFYGRKS